MIKLSFCTSGTRLYSYVSVGYPYVYTYPYVRVSQCNVTRVLVCQSVRN